MMFCPACNGRMIHVGQIPVIFPMLRHARVSDVLICTLCAATTEVDVDTGKLLDYRGLLVGHLYAPDSGLQRRMTLVSLVGGPPLFEGRES